MSPRRKRERSSRAGGPDAERGTGREGSDAERGAVLVRRDGSSRQIGETDRRDRSARKIGATRRIGATNRRDGSADRRTVGTARCLFGAPVRATSFGVSKCSVRSRAPRALTLAVHQAQGPLNWLRSTSPGGIPTSTYDITSLVNFGRAEQVEVPNVFRFQLSAADLSYQPIH